MKQKFFLFLALSTSITLCAKNINSGEINNSVNSTCISPTLSTVTVAPACVGSNFTVVLSGLLPSTFGVATYKIGNGAPQTQQGTANANGTFSFSAPAETFLNGLVLQITKIESNGCETIFADKNVTLVVLPAPTLTTVTAEPTCAGTKTFVVLSGMPPNTFGTATYREGNGPLRTQSGTSDSNGTFSFLTAVLPANANGLVIEITKLKISGGCEASFTDKKVTLVVHPQPTLTTVTTQPVTAGNSATIVLSGLLPNTTATATFKVNNGIPQTQTGTSTAMGKFSFNTSPLGLISNGAVVEITKIVNEDQFGCETSFKNKKVTLVVTPAVNTTPVATNGGSTLNMDTTTSKLVLYPNPVNDVLNIESPLGIQNVVILNMIGQQVLTSNEKQIKTSHLPSGTYLVQIQDLQNNVVTKRIIIE